MQLQTTRGGRNELSVRCVSNSALSQRMFSHLGSILADLDASTVLEVDAVMDVSKIGAYFAIIGNPSTAFAI